MGFLLCELCVARRVGRTKNDGTGWDQRAALFLSSGVFRTEERQRRTESVKRRRVRRVCVGPPEFGFDVVYAFRWWSVRLSWKGF